MALSSCGLQVRGTSSNNGGNTNTGGNPNIGGETFTVGGQASGIPIGKDVKVSVDGGQYSIDNNGSFVFPIQFKPGETFDVDVVTGPGGAYACTLQNDTGKITNANITNVTLDCSCAVGSLGTGAGTPADPFLVYTADQLNNIAITASATAFSKKYKQVCDLDYADISPKPIGQQSNPFMGVYDGNDFYILNYDSSQNVPSLNRKKGLFGYTFAAWLKNINLKNINLVADAGMGTTSNPANMGALVGTASETSIEHVYAQDISINNNGNYFHGIGGLVGNQTQNNQSGNSTSVGMEWIHLDNVDVYGGISNKVAGVVGYSEIDSKKIEITNSHIHSCAYRCGGVVGAIFNKASFLDINAINVTVEGNEAVGGITGEILGVISRAGFVGTVNGLTKLGKLGGIVGKGSVSDPAMNSYTASDVLSLGGTVGVGRINGSTSLIQNVAFDNTQTCLNCNISSGTSVNGDGQFRAGNHASQSSWDFVNTWCLTSTYPRLKVVPNPATCGDPGI